MADDEKTFGRYLGYVATIVGILVVVIPAAIWLIDRLHPGHDSASPTVAASAARGGSPPTTAGPVNAGQRVLLSSLTPEKGAQYIGGLPHALDGKSGYGDAVPLPCPTNDVGDKSHALTYDLNGRYLSLHVQLQPYRATSDESQVQYKFFADNANPTQALLDVNTTQALDIDTEGAQKLTIEIVCQPPGSLAVLTDAYLVHV